MTRTLKAASPLAFTGKIENAMEIFEAKCKRLDAERRGTELKRKVLGGEGCETPNTTTDPNKKTCR